jgi:hypothetical protein
LYPVRHFFARLPLLAAATAAVSACDIPTDLPRGWDTEWLVEASSTTVSVAQLLPTGIGVSGDGSAFTLNVSPVTFTRTLAGLCPPCATLHGATVPKPAFQHTVNGAAPLPAGGVLSDGRIVLTIVNGLTFDPLRPSVTARGSLTLVLRSGATPPGGAVIGTLLVSGADTALPPGGSITRQIDLAGRVVADRITVEATFDSPAGDPVRIDANSGLTVTAAPTQLAVSSTTLRVDGKQVSSGESVVDLTDTDGFVRDHVKRGALELTLTNPFEITGTLTLRIASRTATILKAVELAPGTTEREVTFTQEELRRMFGSELAVSVSGAVWGPAGGVVVTPRQNLGVTANLRVVVGTVEERP